MNFLAAATPSDIDFVQMTITLTGGLAIFLLGMEQMTDALKKVAGEGMRRLLARFTRNRFLGMFSGAFVTAVTQSSSVTTVLLVGFIAAGLMTLQQSIGVIIGSNIGSTVTAQVIAFKITKYALLMVTIGVAFAFVPRQERLRQYGTVVLGLGLVFFGMDLMSGATSPLRTDPAIMDMLVRMDNPLLGIVVGALFTAIIQSSGATTGIIIVLAAQGLITLEFGIALAFGANIGTCVTALLAAIGKPRESLRCATVHILFNVIGVIIWLPFIGWLADFVRGISPQSPDLAGLERIAAEVPRQIANAHTFFNFANAVLFIGFTAPLAWLVHRLVPERKYEIEVLSRPRYLDSTYLEAPAIALQQARLEIVRLGELAERMIKVAPAAVMRGNHRDINALQAMDDDIDALHAAILDFLAMLSRKSLTTAETQRLADLLEVARYIENIGDTFETNLTTLARERIEANVIISKSTRDALQPLFEAAHNAFRKTIDALEHEDQAAALEVIGMKSEVQDLADRATEHLSDRLAAEAPNRVVLFRIENDMTEQLRRVYYFAKRIAKVIADVDRDGATIDRGDRP